MLKKKKKVKSTPILIPRNKPLNPCCVALGMLLCLSVPLICCLLSGIIMNMLCKDKDVARAELVHVMYLKRSHPGTECVLAIVLGHCSGVHCVLDL